MSIITQQQDLINEIIDKDLAQASSEFTCELISQLIKSLTDDLALVDILNLINIEDDYKKFNKEQSIQQAIEILQDSLN